VIDLIRIFNIFLEDKMKNERDIRKTFERLEPLDLAKCCTVGDLVRAMGKCSFVARQLGEVAETLYQRVLNGRKVAVIHDHFELFEILSESGGNGRMLNLEIFFPNVCCFEPNQIMVGVKNWLVVGRYGDGIEKIISSLPGEVIFINKYGLCKPGQVRDGYFPNVVFEDSRFVLPVILAALEEWLGVRRWTVTQLFEILPQYGGLAAEVVHGASVLKKMVDDPDCAVFMTASGAMTVAQLDYLFCDMIENKMIQYLAATGALMAHGLVKSAGLKQFKHRPEHDDTLYAIQKINRVTDTLEPEENFDHIDEIMNNVLNSFAIGQIISPSELHSQIGRHLTQYFPNDRGILKSAYEHGISVCVPAFVDSELGNDLFCHNYIRRQKGWPPLAMDMEKDTKLLMDIALKSKRMGIFSVGGGVPRNNTQNVAPLIEIFKARTSRTDLPDRSFTYGCRICPDSMWYGHLSGCTYSENESWRKMEHVATSGNFAEIHGDATITWPFILK
jgi:deoxyhypusine synthase